MSFPGQTHTFKQIFIATHKSATVYVCACVCVWSHQADEFHNLWRRRVCQIWWDREFTNMVADATSGLKKQQQQVALLKFQEQTID